MRTFLITLYAGMIILGILAIFIEKIEPNAVSQACGWGCALVLILKQ